MFKGAVSVRIAIVALVAACAVTGVLPMARRAYAVSGQGPSIGISVPPSVTLTSDVTVSFFAESSGATIDPYTGYNIGLVYDASAFSFVSWSDASVASGIFGAVSFCTSTSTDAAGTIPAPWVELVASCASSSSGSTRLGKLATITLHPKKVVGSHPLHMLSALPPDSSGATFGATFGTYTVDASAVSVQANTLVCYGSNCGAQPPYNESWDATIDTMPVGTDLGLTLTPAPAAVGAPGPMTFNLSLTNPSWSAAGTNVMVTDVLPAQFVGAATAFSGPGASQCAVSGQTITCTVGAFAPGASYDVTVTAALADASATSTATNCARVTMLQIDPNPADDTACATMNVIPAGPDMVVTGPPSAATGDDITITYSLVGPAPHRFNAYQIGVSVDPAQATITGVTDLALSSGIWQTDYCPPMYLPIAVVGRRDGVLRKCR